MPWGAKLIVSDAALAAKAAKVRSQKVLSVYMPISLTMPWN